jgi:PTS system cellobiose-specific IIB component
MESAFRFVPWWLYSSHQLTGVVMKKIMLCCSAGMSTSLLVKKMVEEAQKRGMEAEIKAFGVAEFAEQVGHYQVVLLGPQVKYMQSDLQNKPTNMGSESSRST